MGKEPRSEDWRPNFGTGGHHGSREVKRGQSHIAQEWPRKYILASHAFLNFQNYQDSLTGEFSIRHADGQRILEEMAENISELFAKNREALKVRS